MLSRSGRLEVKLTLRSSLLVAAILSLYGLFIGIIRDNIEIIILSILNILFMILVVLLATRG